MSARRHIVQLHAQVSLNRTCSGHQLHDTPSLMFQRVFQNTTSNFLILSRPYGLSPNPITMVTFAGLFAQFGFPW